jgi:hypothetical protein
MYCTKCGKKLDKDEIFCSKCGKKAEPYYTASPTDAHRQETQSSSDMAVGNNGDTANKQAAAYSSSTNPTSSYNKSSGKTGLYAGIASAVVVIAVILSITLGNSGGSIHSGNPYSAPQYNAPYSAPYNDNIILPPVDFDFSGGDYDTYDYSDTAQICPSCHGSGSCPICNGTGQYSMYGNELSTCTACGGSGVCSICGGDGYE